MAYCRLHICSILALTLLHHHIVVFPAGSSSTNHSVTPKKLSFRLINRHSFFPDHPSQNDDIRAPVIPKQNGAIFLANISIGEPPVPQLLAMDTGSHVTWTRCNCNSCFDPQKSSTYKDIPSDAPPCTTFDYGPLDLEDAHGEISPCSYQITYMDATFSRGTLAFETYTFVTSDDGTVQVSDAVLGCAHETKPPDFRGIIGVLGLVPTTPYHLLSRTGKKFSYCVGNISDPQYMYNRLILGDGAVTQGDSTPMQVRDNAYVVTLEGISVGDTSLTLDPREFQNNVIVDSGSTLTTLRGSAYKQLAAQIMTLAEGFFLKPITVSGAIENQLCYRGDLEADLKGFPTVTLHLAEGVDVALDVESLFRRTIGSRAFCMTIVESDQTIIGIMAQQNYNLGFDVEANSLSLQRIDCQLLDD